MKNEKLYVIVRSDLSPGDMACQAIHASVDWCMRYPGIAARWHDKSNYLVLLVCHDESELVSLFQKVEQAGQRAFMVTEPDLDDQHTAFAVEHAGGRILSSLPLAFKELAMT